MVIRFQSGWGRLTMIPGSGRNFTPLPNAVRRGIRLQTICRSMQNGEPSIDYGGSEEPTENDEARNRVCSCRGGEYLRRYRRNGNRWFCGMPSGNNLSVGLKPIAGLVSQDEIIPITHSQDTTGSMCRRVTDVGIMLG